MSIAILTAAAANEAAAAQKFGLIPALNEGGPISWAIFSVMVIMSVFSFYIMFTKLIEQQKVLNQAKQVKAGFWRANSLEEGAAKLDKNSAFRQLVDDGISAQKQHGLLTDPVEAHDWLHGAMSRSEESINNKLSGGLAVPRDRGRYRSVRGSARYRYRHLLGAHQDRYRWSGRHRQDRRSGW
jgi:biopolymer transport protein ExbB